MTGPLGKRVGVLELAEKILAGVIEHYDASDMELPPARYIAPGNPQQIAWDCQQLVVSLSGMGWGPAEDRSPLSPQTAAQASVYSTRHAVFSVQIVRCTPTMGNSNGRGTVSTPSPEQIHDAGVEYMRDAGMLSQALVVIASRLRQQLSRSAEVQVGVINTLGPDGAFHAVEGTMAITAGELV